MKEQFSVRVINTKNQSRTTITSTATTLGELKRELDAAGVDYYGMTFMEGATKVELKDDSSILPTNVPVKKNGTPTGETTNNLAFFLTAPDKKIASGAVSDRKEAYAFMKANPDVATKFTEKNGRNYTNASTASLLEFINKPEKVVTLKKKVTTNECNCDKVLSYLDELLDNNIITVDVHNGIMDVINGKSAPVIIKGYTDSDIDEMYGDGSWLK